jgi:hypothetical protein
MFFQELPVVIACCKAALLYYAKKEIRLIIIKKIYRTSLTQIKHHNH